MYINNIIAREVLDSRGFPTVEAEVILDTGVMARAIVPSGASTGRHEAIEKRDNDKARYNGKGVLQAVNLIDTVIRPALLKHSPFEQSMIDQTLIDLDGTPNKSSLGANAILAVSLAVAKVAARAKKTPLFRYLASDENFVLPVPMMNIINGGAHADNNLDIQEFMIIPAGAPSFSEAMRYGAEVFHALKAILKQQSLNTAVGDEGGFAPDLADNDAALALIAQAVELTGLKLGRDIFLGLDVASSELFSQDQYCLKAKNQSMDKHTWVAYLQKLAKNYPIISIEDGMAEDDWQGWQLLTEALGQTTQLVGDDLFVTNTKLLQKGIDEKIANAILIKLNQIGTLTETIAAINMAKKANYGTIISHRSGESEDVTIAHLAVALQTKQIKTGSLCRSERIAKYNQLLRIEHLLGSDAIYAGKAAYPLLD